MGYCPAGNPSPTGLLGLPVMAAGFRQEEEADQCSHRRPGARQGQQATRHSTLAQMPLPRWAIPLAMILHRNQAAATPPSLAMSLPLSRQRALGDRQHSVPVLVPALRLSPTQAYLTRLTTTPPLSPQPRSEDLLRWVRVPHQ